MTLSLQLRGPMPTDYARVLSDYRGDCRESLTYRRIPRDTFEWHQGKLLEHLWRDETCAWLFLVDPKEPWYICGWLCGQRAYAENGNAVPVLHHVYVRASQRRGGIARRLLHALCGDLTGDQPLPPTIVVTSVTPRALDIMSRDAERWLYNPYVLWQRLPEAVKL